MPPGGQEEAQTPGVKEKLAPAARGRKVYSCMHFLHRVSSSSNNNQLEGYYLIFAIINIANLTKSALLHDSCLIVIQGGGKRGLQFIFILFIHYCTIKQTTLNLLWPHPILREVFLLLYREQPIYSLHQLLTVPSGTGIHLLVLTAMLLAFFPKNLKSFQILPI